MIYVGFSQGTAMAYRAAFLGRRPCDGLIALGGDVPPELDTALEGRAPLHVLIGRGTADTWYTHDKLQRDVERLTSGGASIHTCEFEDGHEWAPAFLHEAGRFLDRLVARR